MANGPFDFDVEEKSLEELGGLDDFYSRNVEQGVSGSRSIGGGAGRENQMESFAREQSEKQVAVRSEIDDRLFGIHESRSERAQSLDESLKAPIADSPEQWADDPSHWDWPGIDTPRR